MNRHYTASLYLEKVNLIRQFFPNSAITTDIIAGYPTETEQNFNETLALIDKVQFADIHPFIFSPREGTVAYKLKDIDYETKKARLDKLLQKKSICKDIFCKNQMGNILQTIFEETVDGYSVGYSGNYVRVYVKGNFTNCIKNVKIIERYKDGLLGEIV